MEHPNRDLNGLSRDLLANIMARLDGPTIAAMACTCSELRDLARDQTLWRRLCQCAWPSTRLEEGQHVISSSAVDGFDRFYAEAYPLVMHHNNDHHGMPHAHHQSFQTPTTVFASFVDVYFDHECIFSRVLDGIPNAEYLQEGSNPNDLQKWFLACPFKLELLHANHDEGMGDSNQVENETLALSLHMENEVKDYSKKLQKAVRLSWVLLEKKKGRAVNLSSWKPFMVKKSWASHENYEMNFGCIIPVEEKGLPQKLVRCHITARCKLLSRDGYLRWEEISMCFEDITGAHIPGGKSLIIMNQALYCPRARDHLQAYKCFRKFERDKKEMLRKRKAKETIVDWLCVSIEVAIFTTVCYCILHF